MPGSPIRIYWVFQRPGTIDDGFVLAKTARGAVRAKADFEGFADEECVAELVRDANEQELITYAEHISTQLVELPGASAKIDKIAPAVLAEEDLHIFGITETWREGGRIYRMRERVFQQPSFAKFVGRGPNLITSVKDFLEALPETEGKGDRLFRGQERFSWPVVPAVDRPGVANLRGSLSRVEHERALLEQFKRRATRHLSVVPRNNWEWASIARHHGLPTRLLDWTRNPLVALYFAVREEIDDEDGSVVWHIPSSPPVDPDTADYFEYAKTELYEPTELVARMSRQSSVLTAEEEYVEPDGIEDFDELEESECDSGEFVISAAAKRSIKQELAGLSITDADLFDTLEGLAMTLRFRRF